MDITFDEAILKAIRSLEMKTDHLEQKDINAMNEDALWKKLAQCDDERIYVITALLRKGADIEDIFAVTKMDRYFLNRFKNIVAQETVIRQHPMDLNVLQASKKMGFADSWIARSWNVEEAALYDTRKQNGIMPVYKNVDTCAGEYVSHTPYLYSTYEHENESVCSDNRKIIVLGSGPIRIGQGVEFDYATVHCVKTIRERGYEAIVINNNPETVSTDYSISDKLYFEPLTIEDVMHVIDLEQPLGVVVQFGGQTAINLADKLVARGVKILGTSLEDIDRAEDRHEFEEMLHKLDIPQPQGETAVEVEEAVKIANRIGYPVLVRPSYVLGGRAMEIVHNDDDLRVYMATAVKEISHDAPILVDKYIIGKEMEVDAICDGEHVYIPGIMEHIERAGVHSGDSISVYPAPTASQKVKDTIIDYATRIGKGFHFIGLYNIQFIVETDKKSGEERVYVLEVNPRSSRTVPFLSKVTNVGMSYVATRCVLGDSLKDQGYEEGVHPEGERVFVKAPVFSFAKLRSVDTTLGPEMKSTGEALGGDVTLEKALYKALLASGVKIPLHGNVLITVADDDKQEGLKIAKRFSAIGYGIYATKGTAQYLSSNGIYVKTVDKVKEETDNNVIDVIRKGRVNYVVNTMSISSEVNRDGFEIRRAAAENNISCFTSLDTANAILRVLESQTFTTISMNELEG